MKQTYNKEEVINDIKNNLNLQEIMKKHNISRATIYRLRKVIESESEENNNNISNNNISNNASVNNDKINRNESESNEDEENEQETESNISKSTVSRFDINQFKEELNNEKSIINIQPIENNNNDKLLDQSYISEKSYKSNKTIKSNHSVSFSRKQNFNNNKTFNQKQNEQKTQNIIDVIKNTTNLNSTEDVEELRKRRSTIIIIRQYINTFEKELQSIYGKNKDGFERSLYTLNIDQLNLILENIRSNMAIKSNKQNFMLISSNVIKAIEMVSTNYCNYDVSGLHDTLMQDPEFQIDLNIISCEMDISKYFNNKSLCFMKLAKTMMILNKENDMKKGLNNIVNDKEKLQRILELEKK